MGKVLFTVLMMAAALAAFAVPQVATTSGSFSHNNRGWFDIQSDGSLTLEYYSPGSKYGHVKEFGYSIIDANGNETSRVALDVKANSSVTIGGLKSGNRIGFWMESKKGSLASSINHEFNRINDGSQEYWTLGNSDTEISFVTGYTPDNPSPSGAPLPGVAMTLLLGGAGLCALRRKRSRAGM